MKNYLILILPLLFSSILYSQVGNSNTIQDKNNFTVVSNSLTAYPKSLNSKANFICVTTGRFPKTGTHCKGYYHCGVNPSGQMIQTEWTCPNSTNFNPYIQKCVPSYVCTDI